MHCLYKYVMFFGNGITRIPIAVLTLQQSSVSLPLSIDVIHELLCTAFKELVSR